MMERFGSLNDSAKWAVEMDKKDPLAPFRERFIRSSEPLIYLDGNSLGRMDAGSQKSVSMALNREWDERLIRGWNEGWYRLSRTTSTGLAPIIGCDPAEVTLADSTSQNLHKLAFAALHHNRGRKKIVSDVFNFPTDLYVLQGLIHQFDEGHKLDLIPSRDDIHISMDDLARIIDEDTALLVLSLVAYKSAFLYDMTAVNELARKKGVLVIWDLSHAAGAVPVALNQAGADLAVGCTYKYLNGGPGSPAYLYVRKEWQEKLTPPVWGWFGDADPFRFNQEYQPAAGIDKFLVGTPPILSMSSISPALDTIREAGMESIRTKSIAQTEFLLRLAREFLLPLGFTIGSPGEPDLRGSHITLRHPEGYRICQALIHPEGSRKKVIPDFREPDHIRLGIAPLYTSFTEINEAVCLLEEVARSGLYQKFDPRRQGVT